MTPTPADPGAIDLHAVGSRNCDLSANITELREDGAALIAEVEALRKRVKLLENDQALGEQIILRLEPRAEAAEARVAELKEDLQFREERNSVAKETKQLRETIFGEMATAVEAEEARGVEVTGALKELLREHECLLISIGNANARVSIWHKKARAAVRATSTEALERANLGKELIRVSDAVIDSGRRLRSDPGTHELMLASLCCVMKNLAKLDALGKQEGP